MWMERWLSPPRDVIRPLICNRTFRNDFIVCGSADSPNALFDRRLVEVAAVCGGRVAAGRRRSSWSAACWWLTTVVATSATEHARLRADDGTLAYRDNRPCNRPPVPSIGWDLATLVRSMKTSPTDWHFESADSLPKSTCEISCCGDVERTEFDVQMSSAVAAGSWLISRRGPLGDDGLAFSLTSSVRGSIRCPTGRAFDGTSPLNAVRSWVVSSSDLNFVSACSNRRSGSSFRGASSDVFVVPGLLMLTVDLCHKPSMLPPHVRVSFNAQFYTKRTLLINLCSCRRKHVHF